MTRGKHYFEGTVTEEESELLASLPSSQAEALHEKILLRIQREFPQVRERLTGNSEELFAAIAHGETQIPVDPKLGNTDFTEADFDRLLKESGF